jgi:hypothetical protein
MTKYPVRWLVGAWAMVALLVLLLSGPALAVPISIINPSFEDVSGDGLGGWSSSTFDQTKRGIVVAAGVSGNDNYTSPDGSKVAYVNNGGDLFQNVFVPITLGTTYTLKLYVGHPGVPPDPNSTTPPGDPSPFAYTVELRSYGTVSDVLATISGSNEPPWPPYNDPGIGQFGSLTLSYTADSGHINQFLQIVLMANQSSSLVNFDLVTLDAVPVPPTVWLLGSGLLGLWGIRRRSKKG